MKRQFLDLGKQPIANGFLSQITHNQEYTFNLKVGFDEETKLVSLMEFVEPEKMFNDTYVYHSSLSNTMRNHFKDAAETFKNNMNPTKVLEIGSNDGVFIRHFNKEHTIAVEPCGNFAEKTNQLGYYTFPNFWNKELSNQIVEKFGKQDLIFSANCMCHVQDLDDAFRAVDGCLSDDGVFVFEDPSLLKMVLRGSYDQIYDEHAHIFSVLALQNILKKHNMEIFKVEELDVHGGSNRIYAKKITNNNIKIDDSVVFNVGLETAFGLHDFQTYLDFAKRVEKSKIELVELLQNIKSEGKKVVSYGATSKSTTVFNYCKIGRDNIEYIVDTTPDKQGKFSPGAHIPVVHPSNFDDTVDYAFLGAWNYSEEIMKKEKAFLKRGGKFITHVPRVRIVEY